MKKKLQEQEHRTLTKRVSFVYGVVFISFVALVVRSGYLQITKGDHFRQQAQSVQHDTIPVLPTRGRIYDTNGNLFAYDEPVYSLYLTRTSGATKNDYAALAAKLAPVLNTPLKDLYTTLTADTYYAQIRVATKLTDKQLAYIEENKSDFPNINVVAETQRKYPLGDLAGHLLGYTGRITQENEKKYTVQGYLPTQTVGVSGLELQYEKELQGTVGAEWTTVNSHGGYMGTLGYAPPPVPGATLELTLDGRLQAETQSIITNMISQSKYKSDIQDASAVAIDVKTGGVLAMVSYPYLDPNWYVDGSYTKHAKYLSSPGVQMNNAIQSPMYPGSTVKPANLIEALNLGVINPKTQMVDHMITHVGGAQLSDDGQNHGIVDPVKAIGVSCDTFFYEVGLWMGKWFGSDGYNPGGYTGARTYQGWLNTAFARGITELFQGEWNFGLGQITGIDLPGEVGGLFYVEDARKQMQRVPLNLKEAETALNKNHEYPLYGSPVDLAFAGIGQSQAFTPLQLAQYVATIANNGKRLKPHLVKEIIPQDGSKPIVVKPFVQNIVKAKPEYFKLAQQGMYWAIYGPGGTAYGVFSQDPYQAAGKTGTAQIVMGGKQLDNSVFIAYAPYNNPQIAIAVMVPGAGYGAETAAPLAEQMFNTYFKERHEFFPKSQWTNSKVPNSWFKDPAYTQTEAQK